MRIIKRILAGSIAVAAFGCNDGIDPITPVAPGEDVAAPTVVISYPLEGTLVRVREDVAPITIAFESSDDIEIQKIDVILDGATIATFNSFIDYRRAVLSHTYETLSNGTHTLAVTATDISAKSTTASVNFEKVEPYRPEYDGEVFYLPFDGDYLELVSITDATKVGSPGFSHDAKSVQSYSGADGAYLTLPTTGLTGNEFSAAFWYKVSATPDRSGILTIAPPDPGVDKPNNRTSGVRFFREGSATKQTFILNVGTGDSDSWFTGGDAASINPTTSGWVHLAFTLSETSGAVYINGNLVASGTFSGVDWTGCDILSIASGAPRFTGWDHFSDQSLYDELRIFDKALTQEEVQALME